MLKHYTIILLLISLSLVAHGQDYCIHDAGTYFNMGTSSIDEAQDIFSQDDGWMVGLGSAYYSSSNSFRAALVRFDINYNLDPTFGENGRVQHTWSQRNTGKCIDRTSDGKYVIGGYQAPSNGLSGFRGYIARLNSDGSPDMTYASSGSLELSNSSDNAGTIGVKAMDDGTVKAIVRSEVPRGFFMVQTNSNGELDTNFTSTGTAFASISELATDVDQGDAIFLPDSGAFAIHYSFTSAGVKPLIFKFDKHGQPDSLFNGTGLLVIDDVISTYEIQGIVDDEGYLYISAGTPGSPRAFVVHKLDATTGEAIDGFGVAGRMQSTEQSAWHESHGLIREPSTGNILVFGTGGSDGVATRFCSFWSIDATTGAEQEICGSTDMWDLNIQYAQGYRAATINPLGNVQFWGDGGGVDSTVVDGGGFNFIVPRSSVPSSLTEFSQLEFSLAPNPASNSLTIRGLAAGVHSYQVFDQVGAQVANGLYADPIDLSYLSQGLYTLRVQSSEGDWGSQRFIKD
jgi:hypothetical protein